MKTTFTGPVRVGKGKVKGELRLGDADNTHYVGFASPATVTSNLVWNLPATDGSANQILKTDGSGNLGWATDSTGSVGGTNGQLHFKMHQEQVDQFMNGLLHKLQTSPQL